MDRLSQDHGAKYLRRACVDDIVRSSATMGDALGQLRLAMRTHTWKGAGKRVVMVKAVQACDLLTQDEGFHALHDWDGIADHVNPEIIPVDVLDFVRRIRAAHQTRIAQQFRFADLWLKVSLAAIQRLPFVAVATPCQMQSILAIVDEI